MKKFFGKIKNWFVKHRPSKRRLIQLYTALLYNANIKGFFTGKISTAGSKNVCVPGFNCYSCPGAVGACPLGSLQNALGSSKTSTIAYVFGIIVLYGMILGRTICGFLCPMGLMQDLLYKIKSPKLKKNKITKILSYFKYVLLAVFVIIVPLVYSGVVVLPAFCQYICPVGMLAGFGLLANPSNVGELVSLGVLFTWKFCVTVLILIGAIFVYRLFCRFLCPLGALYSLFSKLALLGIKLDKDKCVNCGLCINTCKVDINHVGDHECIQCGACISVCPTKAISWKGGKLFVLPNQIETPVALAQPQTEAVDLVAMAETPSQINVNGYGAVALETNTDIQTVQIEQSGAPPARANKFPLYALRKNNGRGFKIIALTLAMVLLIFSLVYFNFIKTETYASSTYSVGDTMQDFETTEFFSSDGKYKLSEDSGKIVVLNFWYITCGGCESEMPHFGKLAKDEAYKDKVSVVVVHSNDDIFGAEDSDTLTDGTEVKYIEKYILENKSKPDMQDKWNTFYNDIKWVMDVKGDASLYLSLGGTGAWPMTAIVDEAGVIRFITASSITEEILYQEIDKILAE